MPKTFHLQGGKHDKQLIIKPISNDWAWLDDLPAFDNSMEQAIESLHFEPAQERNFE